MSGPLKRIRVIDPAAIVVMISGHGTIQTAVEATQLGAYDFLEKPLDTDRIQLTLRNALQHVVLREENSRLRDRLRTRPASDAPLPVRCPAARSPCRVRTSPTGQLRGTDTG